MLLSTLAAASVALGLDRSPELKECEPRRKVVRSSAPEYPGRAQRRIGPEGRVLLAISLDLGGAVVGVEILESEPSGFFDRAAIESVSSWQFEKGTEPCWQDYAISFVLEP